MIAFLVMGSYWKALILGVWSSAIVGSVENVLRPLVVGAGGKTASGSHRAGSHWGHVCVRRSGDYSRSSGDFSARCVAAGVSKGDLAQLALTERGSRIPTKAREQRRATTHRNRGVSGTSQSRPGIDLRDVLQIADAEQVSCVPVLFGIQ